METGKAEHIMVGAKAARFTITDDLQQYERHVRDGPPIKRQDRPPVLSSVPERPMLAS